MASLNDREENVINDTTNNVRNADQKILLDSKFDHVLLLETVFCVFGFIIHKMVIPK